EKAVGEVGEGCLRLFRTSGCAAPLPRQSTLAALALTRSVHDPDSATVVAHAGTDCRSRSHEASGVCHGSRCSEQRHSDEKNLRPSPTQPARHIAPPATRFPPPRNNRRLATLL